VAFGAAVEAVNASAGTFSIEVDLSAASSQDVSVSFTLGGSAVNGRDYSNLTASPLVIPAGQTSGEITGTLRGNPGPFQTLTFTLGTPTNGRLGDTTVNTLIIVQPLVVTPVIVTAAPPGPVGVQALLYPGPGSAQNATAGFVIADPTFQADTLVIWWGDANAPQMIPLGANAGAFFFSATHTSSKKHPQKHYTITAYVLGGPGQALLGGEVLVWQYSPRKGGTTAPLTLIL
jgi:hypothetical protein